MAPGPPVSADDSVRPRPGLPADALGRLLPQGPGLIQPCRRSDPVRNNPNSSTPGFRSSPSNCLAPVRAGGNRYPGAFRGIPPCCAKSSTTPASVSPDASARLLVSAAHHEAPGADLLERRMANSELLDGPILAYDDPRRAIGKQRALKTGASSPSVRRNPRPRLVGIRHRPGR